MRLTDMNTVRELLAVSGAFPEKKFGQNFLISSYVVESIAELCGATPQDGILEIGPGIGTLTSELAQRYDKVVAVEIDDKMLPILNVSLAEFNNVRIIHGDILKTDINKLLAEHFSGRGVTVCANLPYYITSQIIMGLLEGEYGFDNITVMIQKEVADRLLASPGTADYGSVTPVVNYYAEPEKLLSVPAGCFYPEPKVNSSVIRLKIRKTPPVEVIDRKLMFGLIKWAFLQRRKTLCNAVSAACDRFTKSDVEDALEACGIDGRIRGEALSLYEFARLSDKLSSL